MRAALVVVVSPSEFAVHKILMQIRCPNFVDASAKSAV